jgi:hypothetical protein
MYHRKKRTILINYGYVTFEMVIVEMLSSQLHKYILETKDFKVIVHKMN